MAEGAMRCPKNKNCKVSLTFFTQNKKQFICAGKPNKPKKCKDDVVKICLKGSFSDVEIEMKPSEALLVVSALSGRLSEIVEP